jgi:hypothetical protein
MPTTSQAAPPERPHTNPLPIASPSGTLFCPNVIVNWTQGKCEKSNLKENFCDLVELKPAKGRTFNSQRFKYKLEGKQQGGKETFECIKDGEPEDVQPPVRVFPSRA